MLSKFEYDGDLNPAFRRGPFRLPVTSIAAYLPAGVPPRFVHVSSAGERSDGVCGLELAMKMLVGAVRNRALSMIRNGDGGDQGAFAELWFGGDIAITGIPMASGRDPLER